jgi:prepilin-type N-terminal cleavage/methylation domain-containing protein
MQFISLVKFDSKRGFTLIELLVVIAIIGILSSIVLASLNTARQKSRDARRVADIKQIQLAMQLYYDASSTYPTALSELAPTYIATIPNDPVGQAAYPYDRLNSGASYHVGANLEDSANQALQSDLDSDTTNVDGADADGCNDEANRYCYDVGP